jgi:HNH endonuclease
MPQALNFLDFEFDHIIAQSHGGLATAENLALACYHCNSHKGPNLSGFDPVTRRITRLFNPRKDRWNVHIEWDGPLLRGRTAIGRVTVYALNMNEPESVAIREMMIEDGHLP